MGLTITSERVSDSEVECEGFLERDIEISVMPGVVRCMQTVPEVASNHHHTEVYAQSHTGAECQVAQECSPLQLTTGAQRVILEQPYITAVYECSSMEYAVNRETILRIYLKFEGTGLVEVAISLRFGGTVTTRTKRTNREGSDRVGTTDIELIGVWHGR